MPVFPANDVEPAHDVWGGDGCVVFEGRFLWRSDDAVKVKSMLEPYSVLEVNLSVPARAL